jgi:GDP-L-fucose synthase
MVEILVTGATGMVGRAVVDQLLEKGCSVTATSLDAVSPWTDVPFKRLDLRDYESVVQICEGRDVVLHVAGIKGNVDLTKSRPATFMGPLLQMNTNVFSACHSVGVQRVVYTSSIGVYPPGELILESDLDWTIPPMDTHPGWAKRIGELQLSAISSEKPDFSYAIVRPSNVYGPGDNFNPDTAMVIGALLGRAYKGETPVSVQGSGNAIRDFVYAGDVANALVQLAFSEFVGDLNIAAGSGISIRELASHITAVTGVPLMFTNTSADEGFSSRVLSVTKARESIGWEPKTDIRSGIDSTWAWLVRNGSDPVGRLDYFASNR